MCFVRPFLVIALLTSSACSSEPPSSETSSLVDVDNIRGDGAASVDGVAPLPDSLGGGGEPDVGSTTDTPSRGGDALPSDDPGPPAGCSDNDDCDDALACTVDTCQPDGTCSNAIDASSCLIDGVCVTDGVTSPNASCRSCQPAASQTTWSLIEAACDDALACTTDVCNPTTGCENTLESGCIIDGNCVETGAFKDGSDCLACQPTETTTDWSEVLAACDDALACTDDVCSVETGCTSTLLADNCLIDGGCVSVDGPKPEANCLSCQPAIVTDGWTEIPNFCHDELSCTDDACDPDSGCTHDIQDGFCVIDGACVQADTEAPDNECLTCQPSVSTTQWSPREGSCDDDEACSFDDVCDDTGTCAGTPYSCEDGLDCTPDICYGNGFCASAVDDGWCLIGGVCWEVGTINPDNQCQQCTDKPGYKLIWVPVEVETPCESDGLPCTDDICSNGQCSHPVYSFVQACRIDGACYGSNATNPNQACQRCDASVSKYAWTDKADDERCEQCGRCVDATCTPAGDLDYAVCDDGSDGTHGDWCTNGSCSGFVPLVTDTGKSNEGYTHATGAGPSAVHALYRDCTNSLCIHRAEYFEGGPTAVNDQGLGLAVAKPGLSSQGYTSFNTMWSFSPATGWSNTTGLAAAFNDASPEAVWHTVANHLDQVGFIAMVHVFGWVPSSGMPVAMRCTKSLFCPTCDWFCESVVTATAEYDASMRECVGVQTRLASAPDGSIIYDTFTFCNNDDTLGEPSEYRFWQWQSALPRWWTGATQFRPLETGQRLLDLAPTPDGDGMILAGSAGVLATFGATSYVFDAIDPMALESDKGETNFLQVAVHDEATMILTSVETDLGNGQVETQVGILSSTSPTGEGFLEPEAWKFNPVVSYVCPSSGSCPYAVTSMAATDDAVYLFGAWSSDGVNRDRAMWYWTPPN